jgi:hypothetical protein
VSRKRSRISLSEAGHIAVEKVERDFQNYWGDLEHTYDRNLPEEVRKSIISAIHALINDTTIEQNALSTTEANQRIQEICHAAFELKSVLNKRSLPDHHERALSLLLKNELKHLGPPRLDLSESTMAATRLVTACKRTRAKIAYAPGIEEGKAWKHFIVVMTNIFEKATAKYKTNFPTGASQSRDKCRDDTPSPFVRLICAIQNKLPRKIRRHDLADPLSLAKKINEARRSSRRKPTDGTQSRTSQRATVDKISVGDEHRIWDFVVS